MCFFSLFSLSQGGKHQERILDTWPTKLYSQQLLLSIFKGRILTVLSNLILSSICNPLSEDLHILLSITYLHWCSHSSLPVVLMTTEVPLCSSIIKTLPCGSVAIQVEVPFYYALWNHGCSLRVLTFDKTWQMDQAGIWEEKLVVRKANGVSAVVKRTKYCALNFNGKCISKPEYFK